MPENLVGGHLRAIRYGVTNKESLVGRNRVDSLGLLHLGGRNCLFNWLACLKLFGHLLIRYLSRGLGDFRRGAGLSRRRLLNTITQSGSLAVRHIFINGADRYIVDRSLEFNQWVSVIVRVGWHGLAVSTEIRVVAHSTLVTRSSDVVWRRLVLAERTITEDAIVDFLLLRGLSDGTVNRDKPMT